MRRRRIPVALSTAIFGATVMAVGIATAQGVVPGSMPPQTGLFEDAVTLARLIPVVAAFGIGFGIWQARRKGPKMSATSVIRHDVGAVVSHWTNTAGFLIGMLTGAIALRWIQRPDDMRLIFQLHYVGSGLVVFAVAAHVSQNVITAGFGLIPRSLRDVQQGLVEIIGYSGVYGKEHAAFHINLPKGLRRPIAEILASFGLGMKRREGKFLAAEKVFSYLPWFIIVSVMLITGLIKAFRYLYPMPPDFVAQASSLHDTFTIVAIVMLVVHLAAVLLVPNHWPMLVSMITTRIPRAYVEKEFVNWAKELKASEQGAVPAAGAEAPPVTPQRPKATKA